MELPVKRFCSQVLELFGNFKPGSVWGLPCNFFSFLPHPCPVKWLESANLLCTDCTKWSESDATRIGALWWIELFRGYNVHKNQCALWNNLSLLRGTVHIKEAYVREGVYFVIYIYWNHCVLAILTFVGMRPSSTFALSITCITIAILQVSCVNKISSLLKHSSYTRL